MYKTGFLFLLLMLFACQNATKHNKPEKPVAVQPEVDKNEWIRQKNDSLLQAGYNLINVEEYLWNRLLIGKKKKIKTFQSIYIKGDMYYELDQGNIIIATDFSNNFTRYFYNNDGQLTVVEYRQQSPPEIYAQEEFIYSKDKKPLYVIEKKYENNQEVKSKQNYDKKVLQNVLKFFTDTKNKYFMDKNGKTILTYRNKMYFVCAEIMPGKNRLTYFINDKDLIDSLKIEDINTGKKKVFEYDYEK